MKNIYRFFFLSLIFIILNKAYTKQNIIQNLRISDKTEVTSTRIVLDLTNKTAYSVFTLDNNPRLVIDLEATSYEKFDKFKSKIIENIRVNNNGKGVIRIVFDLSKKAFIEQNFYLKKNNKNLFRLVIDLKYQNNIKKITKKK